MELLFLALEVAMTIQTAKIGMKIGIVRFKGCRLPSSSSTMKSRASARKRLGSKTPSSITCNGFCQNSGLSRHGVAKSSAAGVSRVPAILG